MMRIGATAHENINFDVGFETQTVEALDKLPGFIGDATDREGDVETLGMSATTQRRSASRYKCYRGDGENALRRYRKYQMEWYGREMAYESRRVGSSVNLPAESMIASKSLTVKTMKKIRTMVQRKTRRIDKAGLGPLNNAR
jgi:hypothetical protein